MVEEEVHHFTCVGEDSEELQRRGLAGVPPQGIEASKGPACAEGFPAEAGSDFPLLGPGGSIRVGVFGMPVGEFGDILEGLHKLVYAIPFG